MSAGRLDLRRYLLCNKEWFPAIVDLGAAKMVRFVALRGIVGEEWRARRRAVLAGALAVARRRAVRCGRGPGLVRLCEARGLDDARKVGLAVLGERGPARAVDECAVGGVDEVGRFEVGVAIPVPRVRRVDERAEVRRVVGATTVDDLVVEEHDVAEAQLVAPHGLQGPAGGAGPAVRAAAVLVPVVDTAKLGAEPGVADVRARAREVKAGERRAADAELRWPVRERDGLRRERVEDRDGRRGDVVAAQAVERERVLPQEIFVVEVERLRAAARLCERRAEVVELEVVPEEPRVRQELPEPKGREELRRPEGFREEE